MTLREVADHIELTLGVHPDIKARLQGDLDVLRGFAQRVEEDVDPKEKDSSEDEANEADTQDKEVSEATDNASTDENTQPAEAPQDQPQTEQAA